MPRVIWYGYPARGHTMPSLPVVAALVQRGVAVDYHSIPRFQGLIEGAGARFVAYPAGYEGLLRAPTGSHDHLAELLGAAAALLPPLLAGLEGRAGLIAFDASAIWGGILARRLGRPSVASITTFALNRSMLQLLGSPIDPAGATHILEHLNTVYRAGYRDLLDVMATTADLKLVYTARIIQPGGRFFDGSYVFLGPLLAGRPRDGTRIERAGARPLAYVSLGTIFNGDHALLLRISEVLADRGWDVIVSLGDATAAILDRWPEHVQAHAFVDQIGTLAQACLFVTHGGMNSVSEALSCAVPMVVIPQAVDQHIVARHMANLGAAVVVERDATTAENLAAALDRIERDRTSFAANMARLQHGLGTVSTIDEAVGQMLALIERDGARP